MPEDHNPLEQLVKSIGVVRDSKALNDKEKARLTRKLERGVAHYAMKSGGLVHEPWIAKAWLPLCMVGFFLLLLADGFNLITLSGEDGAALLGIEGILGLAVLGESGKRFLSHWPKN